MKNSLTIVTITCMTLISTNSFAFPEIPFCPAGGPPGWLNHFNYKRDQNIWRHQYYQRPPVNYSMPDYRTPAAHGYYRQTPRDQYYNTHEQNNIQPLLKRKPSAL